MKLTHTGLAALLVALSALTACPVPARQPDDRQAADTKKKDEASIWMTRKLKHSQDILAALTREDFEAVRKSADAMVVIGYLEKYDRGKNPEYRRQMRYFEDANKELIKQAKVKNLTGATLAYTQLTLSCVRCHEVIRDKKRK